MVKLKLTVGINAVNSKWIRLLSMEKKEFIISDMTRMNEWRNNEAKIYNLLIFPLKIIDIKGRFKCKLSFFFKLSELFSY